MNDGRRVVPGVDPAGERVRHDRRPQRIVRIEIGLPHTVVDEVGEASGEFDAGCHADLREHHHQPGVLADRPSSECSHAGVEQDLPDCVPRRRALLPFIGARQGSNIVRRMIVPEMYCRASATLVVMSSPAMLRVSVLTRPQCDVCVGFGNRGGPLPAIDQSPDDFRDELANRRHSRRTVILRIHRQHDKTRDLRIDNSCDPEPALRQLFLDGRRRKDGIGLSFRDDVDDGRQGIHFEANLQRAAVLRDDIGDRSPDIVVAHGDRERKRVQVRQADCILERRLFRRHDQAQLFARQDRHRTGLSAVR